ASCAPRSRRVFRPALGGWSPSHVAHSAGSVNRPFACENAAAMGRRGRPRHPDILTPREWEVLELLRQRLSNEQIADRLGITLDGAKYHVSQILSKLGVASREEAAAWRSYEEQRRSLWQRFILIPIAAKVVALAILLAATAGIGVLGWSVLANGGPFAGDEGPARECTNLQGCAGLDFPTDGDNLFNFPSPPAGSTCQQVIDN